MAVRLLLTGSVEEQWREVAEPWLEGQKPWLDPRPTVVLTPSRGHGFYLRSRLVEKKVPALGLRFWTPSDARKFLLAESSGEMRALTQSELSLLTRLAAERLLREGITDEQASLRSVARDPGPFLRAYDLVLGAGWDPARDGADYGRRLAAELGRDLRRWKIASQAGIHRLLREMPRLVTRPLAHVLLLGFNATHWPLWDLLQAVCRNAEETLVALDQPRKFGERVDELWIGSWESLSGTGYEIPDGLSPTASENPLAALASSYEEGTLVEARESNLHFIATTDLTTQVQAVVLQVLDYLKRPECTRLGLVFPEADALALGVARQLRRLNLPLNDGPGAIQGGLFETRPWQTWLELQEEPTVRRLIHWLRACEAEGVSCGLTSVSAARAAKLLDRAFNQSLVDDLAFLALHLEKEGHENKIVADFLRSRIALPAESTFQGYLASTRRAMKLLKWKAFLELLPESAPFWLEEDAPISRSSYLAWLREVADSRERIRPDGNHFYGRIHLLVYGQLAGQAWSHLILTGLNEEVWPRLFEAGAFGSRHELAELNTKARTLNRRGTTQGGQGVGHETVAPGRGHCLLPLERYELSLRDLTATLQATSHAICLAALTSGGGRNLLPSDFYGHAWQAKTGQILDDAAFRRLAQVTTERCRQHAHLFSESPEVSKTRKSQDIAATRLAYQARRDPLLPFGPYEFAYAAPPPSPVQLPCKKWETALAHPAHIWLTEIVGTSPWPEGELNWRLAIGTWVHRWLTLALGAEALSPTDLPKLLREAAEHDAQATQRRARLAGIDLYPWWMQVWDQARSITLALGGTLAPELAGRKILSEVSLPSDLFITLPGCTEDNFALQGKIDLLLVEPASAPVESSRLNLDGCTCWIIDFKTGSAKKMDAKAIGEGTGLQIVLYGLAVQALGAAATTMSLHTFDRPLVRQIGLNDVTPITGVFRSLDILHRRGIFGQAPSTENEFAFQPGYPMTTRAVPAEILAAKWALVHEIPPPAEEAS
jgi:hypothetical protein